MANEPRINSGRWVIGAMTGTSLDGIDIALAHVDGVGLTMRVELVAHRADSLGDLRGPLRDLAQQQPMTAMEIASLACRFGQLHADCIERLLDETARERNVARADLIAVHGQTVVHDPPASWQMINCALIAQRFGCPVISDLRAGDLAAGGAGAPITPLADWVLFRDRNSRRIGTRAIVNLGGFCNMTILPTSGIGDALEAIDSVRGFDVCACNHLLDGVARRALGEPYDENGAAAMRGEIDNAALNALRDELAGQRAQGRSLGTGDECVAWIDGQLDAQIDRVAPDDLAATAVRAIADQIAAVARDEQCAELLLAGGGARNKALIESITEALNEHGRGCDVRLIDSVGVPLEAREALCMAVLGALAADGVPITLPAVTGRSAQPMVNGVWWGSVGRSAPAESAMQRDNESRAAVVTASVGR